MAGRVILQFVARPIPLVPLQQVDDEVSFSLARESLVELVVAVEGAIEDWAAYRGSVLASEWASDPDGCLQGVARAGDKLVEWIARETFPGIKRDYRS